MMSKSEFEILGTGQTSRGAAASCSDSQSGELAPQLSIILVNWNSANYLKTCLDSIYQNPPTVPFEIIVVDNASTQAGLDGVLAQFPAVMLIRSEENRGFSAANNLGFHSSRGQYILLLNPDTEVIGPALNQMLQEIMLHPDAGIVGCTLLNSDHSISTTSVQKFPTILNQLLTAEWLRLRFPASSLWDLSPLFSPESSAIPVEVIPGACMLLRREVFEQAGLLTEDYFMYAEDIDLNHKVAQLGYRSYYVPEAKVVHHGGRSSAQQPVSQWSTVMVQRAMLRYFRVTRGPLYATFYRVAMGMAAAGRILLLASASPFADRVAVRCSLHKWRIILQWSLGLQRRLVS